MIASADEFYGLRTSEKPDDWRRAAHEAAPVSVWQDVVARMPEMRFWVAQNKTVPVEILGLLVDDPDARVRDMVARKRKLPEHLQFRLAGDSDSGVRAALAANARVTAGVLETLLRDEEAFVREVATQRIEARSR